MKEKEIRQSNFELMRLISMFLIVLGHVIIHSNICEHVTPQIKVFLIFIEILCYVHVNSFLLLSGYFQYKSSFKLRKVLGLFGLIAFYNIVINLTLQLLGFIDLSIPDLLRNMFFLNLSSYWFIARYIILYCLSPYINILIDNLSKRDCKKMIFVLFIFTSILPYFTNGLFIGNDGYNLVNFVFLYIIGAYMQKYSTIKTIFKKRNINQKQLIFLGLYIGLSIINLTLYYFGIYLGKIDNDTFKNIINVFTKFYISYANPFILLASISYFLFFGFLNIKSKFINFIAKLVFGIYLIHENMYIRNIIGGLWNFESNQIVTNNSILLRVLILTIMIFGWCLIIELIRKLLCFVLNKFKPLRNFLDKLVEYIRNVVYISE